ncbi:class E sortase [Streptomyces sp. NBC_00083]|uniref:class E sortase n=1 Tax=Streptomyces sp. NBC_00083 TaxID=2975647 RepID=UPI00224F2F3E|nr:class E sortase [Streptomyces sp. NBC_00083]MCX5382230.1 class E sortase [Streptomyces sp. NBC_00083]
MPVVVRGGRGRRAWAARGLWAGAELAVTCGLVVLLLVVHQLWWTNREARAEAGHTVHSLEETWGAPGRAGGEPSPETPGAGDEQVSVSQGGDAGAPLGRRAGGGSGKSVPRGDQAYAVIRIPRIGVTAPIAQGISKAGVLDKGYVGHYVQSAQPGQAGNFALAGHRNTHGEPFRYINRLRAGDEVVVETRDTLYTYVVDSVLPQTSARDGGTIAAVPRSDVKPSYGYSEPGHYITLTTCTPEFTSTYRLVVWGKLRSSRPR